MKKPQYKNKGFKNEKELNAWLEFTTEVQIVFEDDGQDFLNWWIDRHGEVLHSDLQSVIWNGKMVDLTKIKIGEFLPLQDGTKITHKVRKVIQFPFKNKNMIDCEKHGIKFSTNGLCPNCPQVEYPGIEIPSINTIICDDAIKQLNKLENESIDLIITDPPYNVSTDLKIDRSRWGKKQKRKAIINFDYGEWDKMSEGDFEKFTLKWYAECKRVLKKGGSIYIFFTKELISLFHFHRFYEYPPEKSHRDSGLIKTKNIISWIKSNPLPAFNRTNYRSAVEFIYFGQKEGGKATFNFGQQKDMKNWFEYPLVQGKKRTKHPTQKPLELIQKFVEVSSNKGDIVLDPFIGSGTTAVAAKMSDRNYIGIEKNPEYVKIANERINSIPQKLL